MGSLLVLNYGLIIKSIDMADFGVYHNFELQRILVMVT